MINLDSITSKNSKERNKKWPFYRLFVQSFDFPDYPYSVSGSGKTKTLLNLIKEQYNIDKIYLYAKDLSEPKYKFLIKSREDVEIKYCNDPNAFIECSNTMDDVYENIDDYNSSRKREILIVFNDSMADIISNKIF